MIQYHKADLFSTKDKIIAHGCNAQGVMGSGVAKQVREKFPWAYEKYADMMLLNKAADCQPGGIIFAEKDGFFIANMITQEMYGRENTRYVSYDAVDKCMGRLWNFMFDQKIDSCSMPKIGAGLGNGNWPVIEQIIKSHFDVSWSRYTVNIYTGA